MRCVFAFSTLLVHRYQAQVNEYKYEKERMIRELQELKRKYYEQRRKERLMKESTNVSSAGGESMAGPGGAKAAMGGTGTGSAQHAKFTGGGFAMT